MGCGASAVPVSTGGYSSRSYPVYQSHGTDYTNYNYYSSLYSQPRYSQRQDEQYQMWLQYQQQQQHYQARQMHLERQRSEELQKRLEYRIQQRERQSNEQQKLNGVHEDVGETSHSTEEDETIMRDKKLLEQQQEERERAAQEEQMRKEKMEKDIKDLQTRLTFLVKMRFGAQNNKEEADEPATDDDSKDGDYIGFKEYAHLNSITNELSHDTSAEELAYEEDIQLKDDDNQISTDDADSKAKDGAEDGDGKWQELQISTIKRFRGTAIGAQ